MSPKPDTVFETPRVQDGTMLSRAAKREVRDQRNKHAVQLALAGASYSEIGTALGVSKTTAYRIVKAELADAAKRRVEAVDQMVDLEASRLDRLQMAVWSRAINGDLGAVDRVLRIMERRAKLFGLDKDQDDDNGGGFTVIVNSAIIPPPMDDLVPSATLPPRVIEPGAGEVLGDA